VTKLLPRLAPNGTNLGAPHTENLKAWKAVVPRKLKKLEVNLPITSQRFKIE
jgi:hypothetical protein